MKSNIILVSTLSALMLVGCGQSIEEQLKAKKAEFSAMKKEIKELEAQLPKDSTKVSRIPVTTQVLEAHDFESFFEAHGVVATDQNIMVNPEFSGTIKEIRVREGQKVNKGQINY